MTRFIAVCNQKGGVGKSTTAVNVAAYLALAGRRTLLVDLDPQGNATTCCGVERGSAKNGLLDVFEEHGAVTDCIVTSSVDGLDVLPAGLELASAEGRISGLPDRGFVLKRACEALGDRYQVVVFDCPPSLGILTENALVAANKVLIPVQCEYLALEGLTALVRVIDAVRRGPNPGLEIGGIVLTMVDLRAKLTREVSGEVRNFFKSLVFETQIPRNVRLAECPSFGKPVCSYDATSSGAIAYECLTNELMERLFAEHAESSTAAKPELAGHRGKPGNAEELG